MDLSPETLRMVVVSLITLILSICVHEFGHAFVADKLGDRLPRSQGRVTLNPMAHADPIGTLALPTMFLLLSGGTSMGFGWGKPVQINPLSFTRKIRMKTGHLLVALAGPAMNILFGVVISLVLLILVKTNVIAYGHPIYLPLLNAVLLNFILAVFNLLPAPPLDGGAVLAGLLPDRAQPAFREYSKYSIFVLFAIIAIPQLRVIISWPAMKLFHFWNGTILGLT
jgi:Zn-dependent protease